MIYEAPPLDDRDVVALARLDALRSEVSGYLYEPRRWFGTIRRAAFARAVQGSNSIEGYNASVEDVVAVIADEPPLDANQETAQAITGYRDAMTYVLQLAKDRPSIDQSLLLSLHFMMMKYDLAKNPGRLRPGAVWVHDPNGHTVYTAPERDDLESLIAAFVAQTSATDAPTVVAAALAHLNLVLIHPFSDGNGRMARCIQSLVLARAGQLDPVFASIEEYLGRNTTQYYDVLAEVAQGSWSPGNSTRPWIEFCVRAHAQQATTLLHRVRETEELWDRCEQLVQQYRLPPRVVGALCDGARGWRLRRGLYAKIVEDSMGETISEQTATRDLAALVQAGLFNAEGEKRGRVYAPSDDLRAVMGRIRSQRQRTPAADPYSPVDQQERLPI